MICREQGEGERKRILLSYLKALRETFPEAWGEDTRDDYSLLQAAGLQISLALMPDIMLRCDFYESFEYNVATFTRQMSMLAEMALLGKWNAQVVEPHIATQAKRVAFINQLRQSLKVRPAAAKSTL